MKKKLFLLANLVYMCFFVCSCRPATTLLEWHSIIIVKMNDIASAENDFFTNTGSYADTTKLLEGIGGIRTLDSSSSNCLKDVCFCYEFKVEISHSCFIYARPKSYTPGMYSFVKNTTEENIRGKDIQGRWADSTTPSIDFEPLGGMDLMQNLNRSSMSCP